jgi:8-oxo-dGTP pyrophosphatase MutT (NUDIX family)
MTATRTVYENPWMAVREDRTVRPDGTEGIYAFIEKPDFAIVIPRENDGFHLVEQYRYPLGRRSLEFPQGTYPDRRSGDPAELARRELEEETGFQAGELAHVGRFFLATGMTDQACDVFLATDLTPGDHRREVTESDMTQTWVPVAEFEAMVAQGRIFDGPSITAYALMTFAQRGAAEPGGAGARHEARRGRLG